MSFHYDLVLACRLKDGRPKVVLDAIGATIGPPAPPPPEVPDDSPLRFRRVAERAVATSALRRLPPRCV